MLTLRSSRNRNGFLLLGLYTLAINQSYESAQTIFNSITITVFFSVPPKYVDTVLRLVTSGNINDDHF